MRISAQHESDTKMCECVRFSKNDPHEKPYNVTGVIKHTGLKQIPKGICSDRIVGTWKTAELNTKLSSDSA